MYAIIRTNLLSDPTTANETVSMRTKIYIKFEERKKKTFCFVILISLFSTIENIQFVFLEIIIKFRVLMLTACSRIKWKKKLNKNMVTLYLNFISEKIISVQMLFLFNDGYYKCVVNRHGNKCSENNG